MTGIALVLIYAGNFLIHMGRKGYEGKMFGGHRKKHLYILIVQPSDFSCSDVSL